jgi:hypothetical protein
MAQQELREPVAVAHPVDPRGLPGAHQVAHRLELDRRHADRLEQASGVKERELTRIVWVRS